VSLKIVFVWDVTVCGVVEIYWHFRGTCCLLLQHRSHSISSLFESTDKQQ